MKAKKRENPSEDDSKSFAIMFTLINSERPMSLSEIAKETGLQANHVFYYLDKLQKDCLIVEGDDKCYSCQPFFKDEDMIEDIDNLLMMIIKIFAKNMNLENQNPSAKRLFKVVLANLRMYLEVFELDAV